MPFYLYNSSINNSSGKDLLVIFWTYEFGKDIEESVLHDLRNKIKIFLNYNPPFEKLLLITHKSNKGQFESLKDFFLRFGLAYSLTLKIEDIITSHFDENGHITVENDTINFNQIKHRIILAGLQKIFNRRGGIIGPSQNVHYVLPSGKHSNIFIRIGNILKKGVEINFMGFTLLPYLRRKTINIYCDTSSIAVAAQAAVNLRKIMDFGFISPNIESFSSYQGVKDFDFKDSADSLFLISTSSSGRLGAEIYRKIEGQTTDDYIITLFKLPLKHNIEDEKVDYIGRVLCDLKKIDLQINKDSIVSDNRNNCRLCKNNSVAIEIIGDEFLTEKQETIPIIIKEKYAPDWFTDVLPILLSQNYISCHRAKRKEDIKILELYLDLDSLHRSANKNYKLLFEKYLNQRLPVAIDLIIYLNDEASYTIAEQIQKFYGETTGLTDKFKLKEYNDTPNFSQLILNALPENGLSEKKGAILVVASSISQSHSIVNISRDLRDFHEKGYQICYFVAAVRTENRKDFDYIRNTLLYGKQFKNETNVFDSLLKLFIPDERHLKISPWQQEIEFLNQYLFEEPINELLTDRDKKTLNRFKKRYQELISSTSDGLKNNLFWEPPGKIPKNDWQKLTPGFVFFQFPHKPEDMSQASVYFTISSVLHHIRTDYKEGNQIVFQQSEHQRKLLDPENFSRFNDGVIQSSLLRASYNIELDYSHDIRMSRKMAEIIFKVVSRKEDASYEFLLALATGKVRLTNADLKQLVNENIGKMRKMNGIISVFLTIIKMKYDLIKYTYIY